MEDVFGSQQTFFIKKAKERIEIVLDFKIRNIDEVLDNQQHKLGLIAEKGMGPSKSIAHLLLGGYRFIEVKVLDSSHKEILHINRPFYLFSSSSEVSCNKRQIGLIKKRFSLFYKSYDIFESTGAIIGHIKPPVWDLGIFPIFDRNLCKIGEISKKCQGWGSRPYNCMYVHPFGGRERERPLLWPPGFVSI